MKFSALILVECIGSDTTRAMLASLDSKDALIREYG